MRPIPKTNADDRFAALLESLDDALAQGELPPELPKSDVERELVDRLQRGRRCVELLAQLRPSRQGTAQQDTSAGAETANRHCPVPRAESWPTTFGRFEIRRELGRGGFGIVYQAHDPLLNRDVALKVPHFHVLAQPELKQRFAREAQAGAGLDHPHVAAVYDAGEVAGVSYIASAYCPGITLAQWLKRQERPVPCAHAAALVACLADAVEHGHNRGILHRDLKPGNVILVEATLNGSGTNGPWHGCQLGDAWYCPKVTDFGLARRLDEDGQTQEGAALGTPGYMAPEQTRSGAETTTAATDVYGLGAVLYELLVGRAPFIGESPLEILDQVRHQDVVPPRRLLNECPPEYRHDEWQDLDALSRAKLATLKGANMTGQQHVFFSPSGKYFGVAHFSHAVDIPVYDGGTGEFLFRLPRDRRVECAAFAADDTTLAVVTSGRANEPAERMLTVWNLATQTRLRNDVLEKGVIGRISFLNCVMSAGGQSIAWLAPGVTPTGAEQPFGNVVIWDRSTHRVRHTISAAPRFAYALAMTPDGRRLAVGQPPDALLVIDPATGTQVAAFQGQIHTASRVAISDDGRFVACSLGGAQFPSEITVWSVERGEQAARFALNHRVNWIDLSSDGRFLAAACGDGSIVVWDRERRQLHDLGQHPRGAASVVWDTSGKRILSAGLDQAIALWDADTAAPLDKLPSPGQMILAASLRADGSQLAAACGNGALWLLDMPGRTTRSLPGHSGRIVDVAYHPDGRQAATAGDDHLVRVWDTRLGKELLILSGHSEVVAAVAYSPDGQRLLSADARGTIKLWDVSTGVETLTVRGTIGELRTACWSPDGQQVCTSSDDQILMWDAKTGYTLEGKIHHALSPPAGWR